MTPPRLAHLRCLVRALAALAAFALAGLPTGARADNGVGDGLYGRLRHDFFVQVAVGGGVRLFPDASPDINSDPSWALMVDVRARMTGVAGIVVGTSTSRTHTSLFMGAEVRPLYPALVLQGIITGRARADLTIQALYVELGVALRFVLGGRSTTLSARRRDAAGARSASVPCRPRSRAARAARPWRRPPLSCAGSTP